MLFHTPVVFITALLLQWQQATTITNALQARGAARERAVPVALAIQHYAPAQRLDPLLVTAIVTVENPTLRSNARNPSGAHGIMQVMPRWLTLRPDWRRICGSNLANVQTNVCVGVRVLRLHLDEHPRSLRRGLLAFNGCRSGHCANYATIILQRHAKLLGSRS